MNQSKPFVMLTVATILTGAFIAAHYQQPSSAAIRETKIQAPAPIVRSIQASPAPKAKTMQASINQSLKDFDAFKENDDEARGLQSTLVSQLSDAPDEMSCNSVEDGNCQAGDDEDDEEN